ncbi:tetratricopeptide repeat protein [Hymenobacter lapidiphilus]|uniref:tetratricopeptide repeat protein n=1 Tax=Hymenobacter sp. CCM 8763 TaxID=2303334 RepID=UPI00167CE7F3|nr:tetratricopeptide repeat protein [Hymenobacter sp. CCM 8763]
MKQLAADQAFVADVEQRSPTVTAAAQSYVNFGWHYLQMGHEPSAIKRFNQAWLLDSTLAEVYYGFSAWAQQKGQPAQSERFRLLGQRYDAPGTPGLVSYYLSLAYNQRRRGNYPAAMATAEQALTVAPDNPMVNSRLGFWLMEQDTARAARYLARAVQLNPQDSVSWLNRGWLRYKQQRYAAAVADYSAAISVNPHYIGAYANRAVANADAGNYTAAIADTEQCLQLAPARDRGQFYRSIGLLKLRLNDKTGACAAFSQALQWGLAPTDEKELKKQQKENCR